MCNLSEGVWEKGMAHGMAQGVEKGKLEQRIKDVKTLLSKGMNFEEAINLLDITPGI